MHKKKAQIRVDVDEADYKRVRAILAKWDGPAEGGEINIQTFVAEAIRDKLKAEESKQKGPQ